MRVTQLPEDSASRLDRIKSRFKFCQLASSPVPGTVCHETHRQGSALTKDPAGIASRPEKQTNLKQWPETPGFLALALLGCLRVPEPAWEGCASSPATSFYRQTNKNWFFLRRRPFAGETARLELDMARGSRCRGSVGLSRRWHSGARCPRKGDIFIFFWCLFLMLDSLLSLSVAAKVRSVGRTGHRRSRWSLFKIIV